MNPSIKLLVVTFLTIEVSFVPAIGLNSGIIVFCLLALLWHRISIKSWLYLWLLPLIPAVGAFVAQLMYGNRFYAWILSSRVYDYVLMSAVLLRTTSPNSIAESLEQNLHLPTQFVWGIVGAFNLFSRARFQILVIRASANMRNVRLTVCSPKLYFKAVLNAIRWSSQLSKAMIEHGFVMGLPRTHFHQFKITKIDGLKMGLLLAGAQVFLLL